VNENTQKLKQRAAERAVEFVKPGMVVGLGHGSTTIFAVRRIVKLLQAGGLKNILGVACSIQVEQEARHLGIRLNTLEKHPVIDLTIDGADEVDPNLDLIKEGGGALLREKIVAQASRREIIVVDESKLSPELGTRWAVPVEVVPFGWRTQALYLESPGANIRLRKDENTKTFTTDQGNLIVDCQVGPLLQPAELAAKLNSRTGIVEYGLFLSLATDSIVTGAKGVRHIKRTR
jgi:ribose 5-phosphate isomerase A